MMHILEFKKLEIFYLIIGNLLFVNLMSLASIAKKTIVRFLILSMHKDPYYQCSKAMDFIDAQDETIFIIFETHSICFRVHWIILLNLSIHELIYYYLLINQYCTALSDRCLRSVIVNPTKTIFVSQCLNSTRKLQHISHAQVQIY